MEDGKMRWLSLKQMGGAVPDSAIATQKAFLSSNLSSFM